MNSLIQAHIEKSSFTWYSWNADTIALAQEQNKIMAVLCVASLDYWSNQWLREIESNDLDVQALQEFYIPVICAVEDHPDVAIRVQEVLAVTGSAASLPAMMWLTPDAHPIGAMPYQAPLDSGETNALSGILMQLADAWAHNAENVLLDVTDMRAAWQYMRHALSETSTLKKTLFLDGLEAHIMNMADPVEGGFGPAPRGNQVSILSFVLQRIENGKASASMRQQCEKTLQAMMAGAMHDHFQNGFFRGVTDDGWNQCFFEKRLIDNTQLIRIFLRAADILDQPLYRDCALRTLDFCLHAFMKSDGASCWGIHAESLGADAQMINGASYLWSQAGIAEIIGSEGAELISKRFFCDDRSYVDETFACAALRGEMNAQEEQKISGLCHRLAHARNDRPQPLRDETSYLWAQAELCLALLAAIAAADEKPPEQFIVSLELIYVNLCAVDIDAHMCFQDVVTLAEVHMAWARTFSDAPLGTLPSTLPGTLSSTEALIRGADLLTQLRTRFDEDGCVAAVEASLLGDPALLSADTDDGVSAISRYLAACRHCAQYPGHEEWMIEAQRIISIYQTLMKQAPLAHVSLLQEWELLAESL